MENQDRGETERKIHTKKAFKKEQKKRENLKIYIYKLKKKRENGTKKNTIRGIKVCYLLRRCKPFANRALSINVIIRVYISYKDVKNSEDSNCTPSGPGLDPNLYLEDELLLQFIKF